MERQKFKEGDKVFHCDNLKQEMRVSRILRQKRLTPTGEMKTNPETGKEESVMVMKEFFIGIECKWWKDGTLLKDKFHSKVLIPAHIVEMGPESIKVFLNS